MHSHTHTHQETEENKRIKPKTTTLKPKDENTLTQHTTIHYNTIIPHNPHLLLSYYFSYFILASIYLPLSLFLFCYTSEKEKFYTSEKEKFLQKKLEKPKEKSTQEIHTQEKELDTQQRNKNQNNSKHEEQNTLEKEAGIHSINIKRRTKEDTQTDYQYRGEGGRQRRSLFLSFQQR